MGKHPQLHWPRVVAGPASDPGADGRSSLGGTRWEERSGRNQIKEPIGKRCRKLLLAPVKSGQ